MRFENPTNYESEMAAHFESEYRQKIGRHLAVYFAELRVSDLVGEVNEFVLPVPPLFHNMEAGVQAGFGESTDYFVQMLSRFLHGKYLGLNINRGDWAPLSPSDKALFARWGTTSTVLQVFEQGKSKKNERINEYTPLAARKLFLATVGIGGEFTGEEIDPDWISDTAGLMLRGIVIEDELDRFVTNPVLSQTVAR